MKQPSIRVVIPTRLHSSRLPGKPLLPSQNGSPHIVNLLNSLNGWVDYSDCFVATDSSLIEHIVSSVGYQCILTPEASNGTERIAKAVSSHLHLHADWIVNIQGDLIEVGDKIGTQILNGIFAAEETDADYVTFASTQSYSPENSLNQGSVWIEVDSVSNIARDFGRTPKTSVSNGCTLRSHIGVYAYTVQTLNKYLNLGVSKRERSLSLEQMRFVDNGVFPFVAYLSETPQEVNTEQDQINRLIREQNNEYK
jgi:3-deoxy-manno-octulosonate cytidylyltransferase (CMP-KDO synthetase)